MPVVHWFRRDCRLADNTALHHAALDSGGDVIGAFIFDDSILLHPDTGAPIVAFMLDCLAELSRNMRQAGSDLVFLRGRPVERLAALCRATGASAVYYNKDYAPAAVERDDQVERELAGRGIAVRGFKDHVIFEEQEIMSASTGRPYTVYTPYRRAWGAEYERRFGGESPPILPRPKLRKIRRAWPASLRIINLPTTGDLGFTSEAAIDIPAGESAGMKMLQRFRGGPIGEYHRSRDFPAIEDGTSRLSPHLRHGTISVRQCLAAAAEARRGGGRAFARGVDAWKGELIWREFFQQILYNFAEVTDEPFRPQWRKVAFPRDDVAFERWWRGTTGYPIVDAAMRQLNATGWMHNRLRMIVSMFLTKDLLLDYRLGERYFMQRLIDGETAQNNGGWQWSASCGTDAQPWFRIFNPVLQSRRFDPQGRFIRRWCPELARVSDSLIHEPHRMTPLDQESAGCRIGEDYAAPVVDHSAARQRALDFLRNVTKARLTP